jgi:hypothetical protein
LHRKQPRSIEITVTARKFFAWFFRRLPARAASGAAEKLYGAGPQEDRQMWFYVQTWLPLLTVALTAAICFGVAAFITGQPKLQP